MASRRNVIILIAYWLIILLSFMGSKLYTLSQGTEVNLKIVPVDPRDLFRGDYVILRYEISTLSKNLYMDPMEISEGQTVFVQLAEKDGYHIARRINRIEPEYGIYLRGKIKRITSSNMRIEYGIESYFVPEGTGRDLEREMRGGAVKVAIDRKGNAVIKELIAREEAND